MIQLQGAIIRLYEYGNLIVEIGQHLKKQRGTNMAQRLKSTITNVTQFKKMFHDISSNSFTRMASINNILN